MLGAVVVAYHSLHDLEDFLGAWGLYNDVDAKLVMVVVEATETERDYAWKLTRDNDLFGLITWDTNVGYAKACNDAARDYAHDDIDTYAFFNADTQIGPGTLSSCSTVLWADPSYAVVGPRQYDEQGRVTHAGIFNVAHPTHRGWMEQLDAPSLLAEAPYADRRDDCITVSGSAYFIKRQVWEDLTMCPIYREEFPDAEGAFMPTKLFYEETACSYHARSHGYKIAYDGRYPMIHKWHSAVKQNPKYAQACMVESREIFKRFCKAHAIANEFA